MTLRNGIIGHQYIVKDLQVEEFRKRRLQALGLTEGTIISVLNNKKNGSVIFMVRGTRLAVGRQISESLTVEEAE
jgi:Fe2+ transport system protein A